MYLCVFLNLLVHVWVLSADETIFLTFNPADVKHPFTFRFSHEHGCQLHVPRINYDAELHQRLCNTNLFHIVASDPVAAVRAFHAHVRTLFQTLLRCAVHPAALAPDGIASDTLPGVFGPVASYYGAVEPQLRGSLHIHMILYIYGFESPQALMQRFENNWQHIRVS